MRLAILLLFVCTVSLFAQDADVAKAVETLKQGLLSADRKTLEGITHENLTYGHSSGLLEDRAAFIEALASGKSKFLSINFTEQSIKVTGNIATVNHKLAGEVITGGNSNNVNLMVLLVFVKVKNEWKLLARQASRI